mmetsp:Transcript_59784/g.112830  ORF Transcript_59784/g.112830 Transcript_59784/m.112830 type:complete len:560 (+) Transcript_59784:71-1750(+)
MLTSVQIAIGTLSVSLSPAAGRGLSDRRGLSDIAPHGTLDVPLFLLSEHVVKEASHPDYAGVFDAYIKMHRRQYKPDSEEYIMRSRVFQKRLSNVMAQNARSNRLWQAGINQFTDRTDEERASSLGWRDVGTGRTRGTYVGFDKLPEGKEPVVLTRRPLKASKNVSYPKSFSWANLTMAKRIPDQADCGGCWAVSAASVLEAHYEIYYNGTRNFSAQQILSCTPNPRDCGGTGGCAGATVELALDWVLHHGCTDAETIPYEGRDMTAEAAQCQKAADQQSAWAGGLKFGMHGYNLLEHNTAEPLMQALYTMGPVAVAAAAGGWMEYQSGIFDGCKADIVVDHAVTLYGYGETTVHEKKHDEKKGNQKHSDSDDDTYIVLTGKKSRQVQDKVIQYWLIRNSWGPDWGEKGFIRLLKSEKQGHRHCGVDTKPGDGIGCKGGPANVTVCGMCGVLYDSVIPHFGPHTHLALLDTGYLPERPLWWDLPHGQRGKVKDGAWDAESAAAHQDAASDAAGTAAGQGHAVLTDLKRSPSTFTGPTLLDQLGSGTKKLVRREQHESLA